MGIDIEQWRARIGTYNGGRVCRTRNKIYSSSHASSTAAVTWATGEIINTVPLPVHAGIAFVSLWMVLGYLSQCHWWKKVKSTHPTKLTQGSLYEWNKNTTATVSRSTVCVSMVFTAAILLYSLALLLIMAGDVELNPGPGIGEL